MAAGAAHAGQASDPSSECETDEAGPMRGLVVAVLVSAAFWVAVGVAAWRLLR